MGAKEWNENIFGKKRKWEKTFPQEGKVISQLCTELIISPFLDSVHFQLCTNWLCLLDSPSEAYGMGEGKALILELPLTAVLLPAPLVPETTCLQPTLHAAPQLTFLKLNTSPTTILVGTIFCPYCPLTGSRSYSDGHIRSPPIIQSDNCIHRVPGFGVKNWAGKAQSHPQGV